MEKANCRSFDGSVDQTNVMGIGLTVQSPAKINWNLRVLGKREDGFHEIESLVSAVTLYDELAFQLQDNSDFALSCPQGNVPTDQSNLIFKAAHRLAQQSGCPMGVTCRLEKRIPIGGGLGGGSSNAASTLLALNRLWSLDWPMEQLRSVASHIGSDVSFFLPGQTAVIRGRGEQVRAVPLPWRGWIVLILPGWPISTAEVYRRWKAGASDNDRRETVPESGLRAMAWMEQCFNMLEAPAFELCPPLQELHERSGRLAGRPVRVSGSGSTLFTAFDEVEEAEHFARRIENDWHLPTRVVQPVEQPPTAGRERKMRVNDKTTPGSIG